MSFVEPVARLRDSLAKTLLVSAQSGGPVASSLTHAGRSFTSVRNGNEALRRVHQESFDLVVLHSTGKEMDLVETVLNLRDIRPSIPLIVLRDPTDPQRDPALEGIYSLAIPELAVLTLEELQRDLNAAEKQH